MTKEETLRKNLEDIISKINEHKAQIYALKMEKKKLRNELSEIVESNSTVINYRDIENADSIEYIFNNCKDDDEIELRDVAFILGMNISTLRSRIDRSRVISYNRFDSHNKKAVRLSVEYIKEFISDNRINKEKLECIKYILKYHNENFRDIYVNVPLRELTIPLGEFSKFKKLTFAELVATGLGRGLFVKPQLQTIQRLLFAYNIEYRLNWTRSSYTSVAYRVVKEPVRYTFRVYHKGEIK